MLGAGDVDHGVQGDDGVEGLRPETHAGHVGLDESSRRGVTPGQLQLALGEVHAGDRETLGKSARRGDARAAAQVQHRGVGR